MDTLIYLAAVLAWLTPGVVVLSLMCDGIKNPHHMNEEQEDLLNQFLALSFTQAAFIVIGVLLLATPITIAKWLKLLK